MAKTKKVETEQLNDLFEGAGLGFDMDMEAVQEVSHTVETPIIREEPIERERVKKASYQRSADELINCLRDETIIVRHLPQPGSIQDPKHVLYGGLAENSTVTITVPRLKSGVFKNVLTDSEKAFLESCMGLEEGALNVYNKKNNFWSNATEGGISVVRLSKQDTILHLKDPIEYIYYKILLANKDKICPDPQTLVDKPKATYQFVLISESSANSIAKTRIDIKKKCWMEYGKIETNSDILRTVIETITGKPLSRNTNLDFLQTRVGELMDADPKLFLGVVTDEYLATRILIKKCVENSIIYRKGDWYYLREDNSALCEGGEEPTMANAARYLANPKRQSLKFALELKLKE